MVGRLDWQNCNDLRAIANVFNAITNIPQQCDASPMPGLAVIPGKMLMIKAIATISEVYPDATILLVDQLLQPNFNPSLLKRSEPHGPLLKICLHAVLTILQCRVEFKQTMIQCIVEQFRQHHEQFPVYARLFELRGNIQK